jgi:hypothetical protein
MIPEEARGNIIMSSVMLIRAITKAYGAEDGMELWSKIAEVLDPAIKGEVFKAMLIGEFTGQIRIKGIDSSRMFDRIGFVRLVRTVDQRRLGLKEAMDIVRTLEAGREFDLEINEKERTTIYRDLNNVGILM